MITLSESFRALFYAPFCAAHAICAYTEEGVDVEFRPSSDPDRAAASLRSGEVEVMWGGPLRVLTTHDADPASRGRLFLRRGCAGSIFRDRDGIRVCRFVPPT
jgi:hypothetical protein